MCRFFFCELPVWPLHVFPSGCSVKPTGQLQRTPVDVSLQVQSHPPLFTAQVSEITAHNVNVCELPTFLWKMLRYPSMSDTRSLVKQKLYCTNIVLSKQNNIISQYTYYSIDFELLSKLRIQFSQETVFNTVLTTYSINADGNRQIRLWFLLCLVVCLYVEWYI